MISMGMDNFDGEAEEFDSRSPSGRCMSCSQEESQNDKQQQDDHKQWSVDNPD